MKKPRRKKPSRKQKQQAGEYAPARANQHRLKRVSTAANCGDNLGVAVAQAQSKVRHGKNAVAILHVHSRGYYGAEHVLAEAIGDALDPARANGKVKRFSEMSEDERAQMRALYAKKGK